ncbi:SPFH domain-containing protein [Solimonas terrae]|uniref:SPFH domain-containing protein n=1 Tax=Solimonas terrae TaxID=1396819 RepID=A0A6M2BSI7_9GAMM|nr:SPFH domain-containing protein [Solimonas terrae]NGY05205.1 SPFH domain-containing protein [Solimonas terrae]
MKSLSRLALLVALLLVGSGCTVVSPDAGQAAVLIDKPWFFGHGGVREQPVLPGLTYAWYSTEKIYINMFPQQYDGNFTDLMSSDGVPLDFHTVIRLQVVDPVALVRDFGKDWYQNNVEQEFFNRVRSAVKKHGMNETAIQTTAIDEIDDEVTQEIDQYLKQTKLPVRLLKITVGKANPPDAVRNQRIETAQQEQRVLTEHKRDLAEQSRKAAELSRAEADNAYRNAIGLSPAQFVEMERIKMQQDVCGAKDAHCTFIIGGNVTPVVSAK